MKPQTGPLFYELLYHEYIDRLENPEFWHYYEDPEVRDELTALTDTCLLDIIRTADRIYISGRIGNGLFTKNNMDFRKDISANGTVRSADIDLIEYLTIYLLKIFFCGEGADPLCRDFISKEEFIKEFTEHCMHYENKGNACMEEFADNFITLANTWINMKEGSPDSMKFDEKYGLLNRALIKFDHAHDDIFFREESGNIRPTRKCKDKMPYVLRKDRVVELNYIMQEVDENAENQ